MEGSGDMRQSYLNKPGLVDMLLLPLLLLIFIATLYPFLNLLFISLSSMEEVVKSSGVLLYPKSINLEGYRYVLRYAGLLDAYKITILVTAVGTTINLVLTTLGAYVLSNPNLPGRNLLMLMVLISMLFHGGMIPTYLVVKNLHLVDTLWALMLPGAISAWLLILTRNFFQGIPAALRESAKIDGCSEWRILVNIMLPLSLPIVATLSLFYGVSNWNDYYHVVLYINDPKLSTLQLLVRRMFSVAIDNVDSESLPPPVETVRAATVFLATLPIICIYPFLQKYFVQGMMVGSIKG